MPSLTLRIAACWAVAGSQECSKLGGCPTGEARVTRGHELPASWVIHTVGPVWKGGTQGEAELLAGCYRASLRLAVETGARTVAFPAISCGIYGYPLERAARVAVGEVVRCLRVHEEIDKVLLVGFDSTTTRAYREALG